jgi:hypothetical protein
MPFPFPVGMTEFHERLHAVATKSAGFLRLPYLTTGSTLGTSSDLSCVCNFFSW